MADGQQISRLLLIKIGQGDSPETFQNLCGLVTRSFNMSTNAVDTTIPDCTDPSATPQATSEPGIKQRNFSGSGKYVKGANSSTFIGYVSDGEIFNAEVVAPGIGTWSGPFFVSDFTLNGEMEGTMGFDATFNAAGALTFEAET